MKKSGPKQLRFNFSDYSAEQQESDFYRYIQWKEKQQPHLYLLKINGMWSHITFKGGIKPHFYEGKNLFQVYNEIKDEYKEYKVKYIINEGLENYLKQEYKKEQIAKAKQLQMKFNEREQL